MGDDYDDLVSNIEPYVPEDMTNQTEINDFLSDRFDRDTLSESARDVVSDRLADKRREPVSGSDPFGDVGDVQFNPEDGGNL